MDLDPTVVLRADRPTVIDETVDAEAVLIHLGTGRYYSFNAAATDVWELVGNGMSVGDVQATIEAAHPDDAAAATAAVAFVAELVTEGLLVEAGDAAAGRTPSDAEPRGAWSDPPALQRFDDLQDLLLVDPIHDIRLGADGWPVASPR